MTAAAFVDGTKLMIAEDADRGSKVSIVDLSVPACPGSSCGIQTAFEVAERITTLVADPTGQHFLAATKGGSLYRWSVGDAHPKELADDVTSAAWIPGS